jgi:plasmid stability protein
MFAVFASIDSTFLCSGAFPMSTLTIRNLEPGIKDKLRQTAAAHGRSMEEEVRSILRQVLSQPAAAAGLGGRIHARFAALGGAVDLTLPERTEGPRAAQLDDDEGATA